MSFEKLRHFLNDIKEHYGVPFWECRIICKNSTIFDAKAREFDKTKNVYYIYSMTKIITAVAAMRLIEQNKLALTDPVGKYLPQFATMMVKTKNGIVQAKNKLTVAHLLSMQGGFNYDTGASPIKETLKKNPNASTQEIANAIGKIPLEFEPGEGFAYSLCYDVLGAVIEKAANRKLGEFMKQEIFQPLGMNQTTFDRSEAFVKDMAPQYLIDGVTGKAKEIPGENPFVFSSNYESGGAGLISTLDDYCKFVSAITNGGTAHSGYRLLTRQSIEEMCKLRMTDEMLLNYHRYPMWGCHYAFSVRVFFDETKCKTPAPLGCFELTGAAGSYAVFDVKNNSSIVYFQHTRDAFEIAENAHHIIRDLAYEELRREGMVK